ncbi:hypothetical protein SBD_4820 [Streptomyces bottropensis ATCC 25435]|uniref:Uncharacterized protein n=1 Tax=Streptomyces bottropensis ATCC 25435 TaxID=1054862 RepID=M3EAT4_9ACTN|nr:hypothetical protein SBD_4820 [Streptomyces bottropensis ATCC 25435]
MRGSSGRPRQRGPTQRCTRRGPQLLISGRVVVRRRVARWGEPSCATD